MYRISNRMRTNDKDDNAGSNEAKLYFYLCISHVQLTKFPASVELRVPTRHMLGF